MPKTPPLTANTSASVRSCRVNRPDVAPSDIRRESSRRRAAVWPMIRLATFTTAMRSTRTTIPSSNRLRFLTPPTRCSRSASSPASVPQASGIRQGNIAGLRNPSAQLRGSRFRGDAITQTGDGDQPAGAPVFPHIAWIETQRDPHRRLVSMPRWKTMPSG